MDITPRALQRIRDLKSRQGRDAATGVRLTLRDGSVSLEWDDRGPRVHDLVLRRQAPPIFLEARAFARLADYELDVHAAENGAVFLLRPKKHLENNRRTPS